MKRAILICLLVAGCASPPRERIVTKEVRVPVAVSCAAKVPPEPEYADAKVSLDSDIFELVRSLLIGLKQRDVVIAQERAARAGCGG